MFKHTIKQPTTNHTIFRRLLLIEFRLNTNKKYKIKITNKSCQICRKKQETNQQILQKNNANRKEIPTK